MAYDIPFHIFCKPSVAAKKCWMLGRMTVVIEKVAMLIEFGIITHWAQSGTSPKKFNFLSRRPILSLE
jgi:hypothetical protein